MLLLLVLPAEAATVTATYNAATDIPVTSAGYTATGNVVDLTLNFVPAAGTELTVVRNNGLGFISGRFSNLAQGQVVGLAYGGDTHYFVANYYGGTGNDLVLTWASTRLFAWGQNVSGQLGDGSTTARYAPVAVATSGTALSGRIVLAQATGQSHSLVLCSDGVVLAWGQNNSGQLGDGTGVASSVPVVVNPLGALAGKEVVAVAAGTAHSLALCSDGTVVAWGSNTYGQLGNNSTVNSLEPVAVTVAGTALAGKSVVGIAAGYLFSLAVCSDGSVVAWGYNQNGQLGDGTYNNSAVAVAVDRAGILATKFVVRLTTCVNHTLALCVDGTLVAWGYNFAGELGDGTTLERLSPVAVTVAGTALAGKTVTAVAAGEHHSLALCTDGTLAAWGQNSSGQLGDGTTAERHLAVAVSTGGTALAGRTITGITAGTSHSVAVLADGGAVSWGKNATGQLGDGTAVAQRTTAVTVNTAALTLGEGFIRGASGSYSDFNLALVHLPGPGPEISVFDGAGTGGTERQSNSGAQAFATTLLGASSAAQTFTIKNVGAGMLYNLALSITGAHAGDFSAGTLAVPVLAPGASTSFTVTFTPTGGGSRSATVRIASNDADENPFLVNVAGDCLVPLAATFASASDVPTTAAGYTATGNNVNLALGFAPVPGTELTVIRNTGADFITGRFNNLAQAQAVTLSYGGTNYHFIADYYGGNGNDLVLAWAARRPTAWGRNADGQLGDGTTTQRNSPVAVTTSGALMGKTVLTLANGLAHSLALCADGTLYAWGQNTHGQLGDGTTTSRSSPVAVTTSGTPLSGKTVVAIAAGAYHNLALCSDGTLVSWGFNDSGQLGDGTTTPRSSPVVVTGLGGRSITGVAAGYLFSLALCSDGTVLSWGYGVNGQLGSGAGSSVSPYPSLVYTGGVLSGKTVVTLAANVNHTLALCSDGTLVAWGYNFAGQLGDNTTTASMIPVAVTVAGTALAGKTVVTVAVGEHHSLALCSDGTIAAWGQNSSGQLGDGTTTERHLAVAVTTSATALAGKTIKAISGGTSHSLALCTDGTLAAWGRNNFGQLGDNTTTQRSLAVAVSTAGLSPGEVFTRIGGGSYAEHTLALSAGDPKPALSLFTGASTAVIDQRVSNAGALVFPQTAVSSSSPAQVFTIQNSGQQDLTDLVITMQGSHPGDFILDTTATATSVAPGASTTFTVMFSPSVTGTRTATVQLGSATAMNAPFLINLSGNETVAAVYNSASDIPISSNGYTASGRLLSPTLNFAPAVGTNLMVVQNTGLGFIPDRFTNLAQGQTVTLSYGGQSYSFVANYYGGTGNDLVLVWAANRLLAWGQNTDGQLGDNSSTQRNAPVAVTASGALAGRTVLAQAAGLAHSLALCSDGTLVAWGQNTYGQLGDGTTTPQLMPIVVPTAGTALAGKTVVAISAGAYHSLALCSDGTVAAWGYNNSGQLGDGSVTNRLLPVAVTKAGTALAGKSVVSVAAAYLFSIALCSDGTVATWGYGANGQLGNGGFVQSNVATAVQTTGALLGKTVAKIATCVNHTLALCTDGTLVSWGYNFAGELGNNTTTSIPFPVLVSNGAGTALLGKTVVAIAAGDHHSMALCSDGTLAAWGQNTSGQLGIVSGDVYVPMAVTVTGTALAGKTVASIAAGTSHSLALCTDGSLVAWGKNVAGELGDTTTTQRSTAVAVSNAALLSGERYAAVASGSYAEHSLAVVASKAPELAVFAGSDSGGLPQQNGTGSVAFYNTAVGTTSPGQSITLQNTGSLSLTGLAVGLTGVHSGDFSVDTSAMASSLAPGASTTITVSFTPAASGTRSVTLQITGTNAANTPFAVNLLGNETINETVVASFAAPNDVPVTTNGYVVKGRQISLALNFAPPVGTNLVVIRNTGLGFIPDRFVNLDQGQLVTLTYAGTSYQFVANYYGGSGNDLVLTWAANRALAWGQNTYGQLGDTTTTQHATPTPVSTAGALAGRTIVAVSAGPGHSLALCADGTVVAWGRNAFGEVGDGTTTTRLAPVVVPTANTALAGKTVVAVAAGYYHSMALCSDGTVATWGMNNSGQLGDGTGSNRLTPVAVRRAGTALAGKVVTGIAAGLTYSEATCADGTVVTWGNNGYGQLGNGGTATSLVATSVVGTGVLAGKMVARVATNTQHSLALASDGTLVAWGDNAWGQLGNGTTTGATSPVAVTVAGTALQGKTVTAIAVGESHSLALSSDGKVASWGKPDSGQLGFPLSGVPFSPMAVATTGTALAGKTVTAIAAGYYHSLALCSDGTLTTWGANFYGQLGNAAFASSSSFTALAVDQDALAAGERFVQMASGPYANHSIALAAYGTPLLVVERPVTTPLSSGAVESFGGSNVGSAATLTYTIRNIGTADLTGLGITIDGPDAAMFTVTAAPTAPVSSSGGTTNFTIQFSPVSAGSKSAVLHLTSNDPAQGAFDLNLAGTGLSAVESWRTTHFGAVGNTGNAANSADPDGDGLANLIEYTLGLDPLAASATDLPQVGVSDPYWTYTFKRPTGQTGVTVAVEASTDLIGWSTTNVTVNLTASAGGFDTYTATYPLALGPKIFFRLKVTQP